MKALCSCAKQGPIFDHPKVDPNPGAVDFPRRDTVGFQCILGQSQIEIGNAWVGAHVGTVKKRHTRFQIRPVPARLCDPGMRGQFQFHRQARQNCSLYCWVLWDLVWGSDALASRVPSFGCPEVGLNPGVIHGPQRETVEHESILFNHWI